MNSKQWDHKQNDFILTTTPPGTKESVLDTSLQRILEGDDPKEVLETIEPTEPVITVKEPFQRILDGEEIASVIENLTSN